jgi:hypothetical protein
MSIEEKFKGFKILTDSPDSYATSQVARFHAKEIQDAYALKDGDLKGLYSSANNLVNFLNGISRYPIMSSTIVQFLDIQEFKEKNEVYRLGAIRIGEDQLEITPQGFSIISDWNSTRKAYINSSKK